MKILSISLKNFASYKELDFTFDSQGLTLIHGATGSGKSTLADAIPWVLFGITAKGGPVSDVLSWNSGEFTHGEILIEINSKKYSITRIRGKNNDLFIWAYEITDYMYQQRGKDILDTQKLINKLLGLTPELYLSAAYYHEFSQTAQFFTTTAKNRRTITEQLVDLSLPKKLQEKISEQLKSNKQELAKTENELILSNNTITQLNKNIAWEQELEKNWNKNLQQRLDKVQLQYTNLELKKDNQFKDLSFKLENISPIDTDKLIKESIEFRSNLPCGISCKECGRPKTNPEREAFEKKSDELDEEINKGLISNKDRQSLLLQLIQVVEEENPYLEQLNSLKEEANYHSQTIAKYELDLIVQLKSKDILEEQELYYKTTKADLETLEESVAIFRSLLIKNTILDLETQTNTLLHNHFEGEIRIELSSTDNDKLEVSITKDGNTANYTQLSKGQRCMLKLCFAIAVMKAVQNHHGISINQLWLDEALDGLDDNMKLKAVNLLEKLSLGYGSIYFVEHSETIKALVDQKIHVELVNGCSEIEKQ